MRGSRENSAPSKGNRREKVASKQLKLANIEGHTAKHNRHLVHSTQGNVVAYAASSVVVLLNYAIKKQNFFIQSRLVSCLAFSHDGKYLAVGATGHHPTISIYDTESSSLLQTLVTPHEFGVGGLSFSSCQGSQFIASVGFHEDATLLVWNWSSPSSSSPSAPVASEVLTKKSYSIASSDASVPSFVVAGEKFIHIYSLSTSGVTSSLSTKEIALSDFADSTFVDVAYARGRLFAVSSKGSLVCGSSELNNCVDLKTQNAYSISISEGLVCCGCSDSTLRIFDINSLTYIGTLPRSHAIGSENKFITSQSPSNARQKGKVYPDIVCNRLSYDGKFVFCIYSDRSTVIWDISNPKKPKHTQFWFPHSASVWDVINIEGEKGKGEASFVTCSSDGTLRFWKHEGPQAALECVSVCPVTKMTKSEAKPPLSDYLERIELPPCTSKSGLRCLSLSSDGSQLAMGDVTGNVRLMSLPSAKIQSTIPAHDGEVLQLDFCSLPQADGEPTSLLASASRDRLVHVYDTSSVDSCRLIHTLDDHSAAVTCLSLQTFASKAKLITAAADKSLIFRNVEIENGEFSFQRYRHAQVSSSVAFLRPNHNEEEEPNQIIASAKDKRGAIWRYDTGNGKALRLQETEANGFIVKMTQDASGVSTAVATSDKGVTLTDTATGGCHGVGNGHGEVVTGMAFSSDHSTLVSVSGDGCLFSWHVPSSVQASIKSRVLSRAKSNAPSLDSKKKQPVISEEKLEEPLRGSGTSIDDIFGGVANSLPPWLAGGDAHGDSSGDVSTSAWADVIQDEDNAFACFDLAPKQGRRYTIEPSDFGADDDGTSDDSDAEQVSRESRRMSISSFHRSSRGNLQDFAAADEEEQDEQQVDEQKEDKEHQEENVQQPEEHQPKEQSEEQPEEQQPKEQPQEQQPEGQQPEEEQSEESQSEEQPEEPQPKEQPEEPQSEEQSQEPQPEEHSEEQEVNAGAKNATQNSTDPDPKKEYAERVAAARERLRSLGLLSSGKKTTITTTAAITRKSLPESLLLKSSPPQPQPQLKPKKGLKGVEVLEEELSEFVASLSEVKNSKERNNCLSVLLRMRSQLDNVLREEGVLANESSEQDEKESEEAAGESEEAQEERDETQEESEAAEEGNKDRESEIVEGQKEEERSKGAGVTKENAPPNLVEKNDRRVEEREMETEGKGGAGEEYTHMIMRLAELLNSGEVELVAREKQSTPVAPRSQPAFSFPPKSSEKPLDVHKPSSRKSLSSARPARTVTTSARKSSLSYSGTNARRASQL